MTMLSAGFNTSSHWERSGEPGCRPVGILFLQFSTEIIVKKTHDADVCYRFRSIWDISLEDMDTDILLRVSSLIKALSHWKIEWLEVKRKFETFIELFLFPTPLPAVSFLMILLSHPCTTSQPLRWANGMWRPIQWEELSGCQVNLWKGTHLTPAGWLWHQQQTRLTHFSRDWKLKTIAYIPKVSSRLISVTQRSNKCVIQTITRVARRQLSLHSFDFSFFLHCCMCDIWDVCN